MHQEQLCTGQSIHVPTDSPSRQLLSCSKPVTMQVPVSVCLKQRWWECGDSFGARMLFNDPCIMTKLL